MSGCSYDQDCAPDIRILWDKQPVARRPHLCDRCNEVIAPGTQYRSTGIKIDGEFQIEKEHLPADCPKQRELDAAEAADSKAQFERDRERYFPQGDFDE